MINLNEQKTNILFIHHSTGGNLLHQGEVRKLLYEKSDSVAFWDHGYNLYAIYPKLLANIGTFHTGLSDENGIITGTDFNIILSNNTPKEYAEIFNRESTDPTLSKILQFDIIIFKNCFPTTHITSDEKLSEIMKYYEQIRTGVSRFADKKFMVFTPPPLRSESTKPEYAQRARVLAQWMISPAFFNPASNLSVFDFYSYLSDGEGKNKNMLRREYSPWFFKDSHPNKKANIAIAPRFVAFISKVVNDRRDTTRTN